jgi:hypothetical protein
MVTAPSPDTQVKPSERLIHEMRVETKKARQIAYLARHWVEGIWPAIVLNSGTRPVQKNPNRSR